MARQSKFTDDEAFHIQLRCEDIPFSLEKMVSPALCAWITQQAQIHNTHSAFILSMLLGTTAGLIPCDVQISEPDSVRRDMATLFIVGIGLPSCGKTSAFSAMCTRPMCYIQNTYDHHVIFEQGTKEGLVKLLNEKDCHHVNIASDEMAMYLESIIQRQINNSSGETKNLCKSWSGQTVDMSYATRKRQHLEAANICLTGTMQTHPTLDILMNLPLGDGFRDRLMFVAPYHLRTPADERRRQFRLFTENQVVTPEALMDHIYMCFHGDDKLVETIGFTDTAAEKLLRQQMQSDATYNEAKDNKVPPPAEKFNEGVKRLGFLLRLLESRVGNTPIADKKLDIRDCDLNHAEAFLDYSDTIKEILLSAVKEKVNLMSKNAALNTERVSMQDVSCRRLMLFKDNSFTALHLKRSGPSGAGGTRALTTAELRVMLRQMALDGYGTYDEDTSTFTKAKPGNLPDELLAELSVSRADYARVYNKPTAPKTKAKAKVVVNLPANGECSKNMNAVDNVAIGRKRSVAKRMQSDDDELTSEEEFDYEKVSSTRTTQVKKRRVNKNQQAGSQLDTTSENSLQLPADGESTKNLSTVDGLAVGRKRSVAKRKQSVDDAFISDSMFQNDELSPPRITQGKKSRVNKIQNEGTQLASTSEASQDNFVLTTISRCKNVKKSTAKSSHVVSTDNSSDNMNNLSTLELSCESKHDGASVDEQGKSESEEDNTGYCSSPLPDAGLTQATDQNNNEGRSEAVVVECCEIPRT